MGALESVDDQTEDRTMTRFTGFALPLMALAVSAVAASAASAQTCRDMVEQFAAAHDLSAEPPPQAPPSVGSGLPPALSGSTGEGDGTITSEELAESGGVIQPPDVGAPAVIQPPPPAANGMPTAPAIRPDPGVAGSPPSSDDFGQAAHRAQLDSLITGALAAADEGDEARCLDSLAQAHEVAESAVGTGESPRMDAQ
ncbi:hypothetical protein [Azospirillum halopraeferens]|uniref:hypothetical protein n=1 Tax=Azospirillum halopraeferens TaxID=34010 RepID=UPI0003FD76F3|nr:hypothetical protein [Azospirillum halopraeferens]